MPRAVVRKEEGQDQAQETIALPLPSSYATVAALESLERVLREDMEQMRATIQHMQVHLTTLAPPVTTPPTSLPLPVGPVIKDMPVRCPGCNSFVRFEHQRTRDGLFYACPTCSTPITPMKLHDLQVREAAL